MNEIQKYIAAHEPKMMDDLFSLIRIPSISALPEHHDDMLACAERWAQLLLEAGVDEALVMPSQGNPVVTVWHGVRVQLLPSYASGSFSGLIPLISRTYVSCCSPPYGILFSFTVRYLGDGTYW